MIGRFYRAISRATRIEGTILRIIMSAGYVCFAPLLPFFHLWMASSFDPSEGGRVPDLVVIGLVDPMLITPELITSLAPQKKSAAARGENAPPQNPVTTRSGTRPPSEG